MSTPSDNEALAKAIHHLAQVHDKQLGAIAKAIDGLAVHVKYLGNGNTNSDMGAIEFLGTAVEKAGENIAHALHAVVERD